MNTVKSMVENCNMLDIGIIIFDIDSAKKILPKSNKQISFVVL